MPDPYKVLQVDPSAGADVIEAAYKRLAKKYHPDVASGPEAQERMVQINLARDILRDPMRRAAIDRARVRAQSGSAPTTGDDGHTHASTSGSSGTRAGHVHSAPADAPRPATPDRHAGHTHNWPFQGMSDPNGPPGERPPSSWTSGRSTEGSAYDPSSMGTRDGLGAAGPPPGNPSGSILTFGRYNGWTLGEIARMDLEYLEWLDRTPIGRAYVIEIDKLLRAYGRRETRHDPPEKKGGRFRR
jgi:curved DNA-binding protein CbpA